MTAMPEAKRPSRRTAYAIVAMVTDSMAGIHGHDDVTVDQVIRC